MGNCLFKIYICIGDQGIIGLGDGLWVDKDSLRVEVYGMIDELNFVLGMVLVEEGVVEFIVFWLQEIQYDLFDLGVEFCVLGYSVLIECFIICFEQYIDVMNVDFFFLKEFILFVGNCVVVSCYLVCIVC